MTFAAVASKPLEMLTDLRPENQMPGKPGRRVMMCRENRLPGNRELSRRSAVIGLLFCTAAAPMLIPLPAAAQAQSWREFRRADLGFRVEMPDDPEVNVDEDQGDAGPIKSTEAELEHGDLFFAARHSEHPKGSLSSKSAKDLLDGVRDEIVENLGFALVSDNRMSQDGFPAGEFVFDGDDFQAILRLVVVGDRMISVRAEGSGRSIKSNPMVQRFLASFTILPGAR